MVFGTILSSINGVIGFIKNNPKFFLGVIFALMVVLLFKQCDKVKNLKYEIKVKEVEYGNEKNRFFNNIQTLKDSVEFVEGDNLYIKSLLRVKEDELSVMDNQLESARINIKVLANKLDDKSEVKNIYITEISSELTTNDVMTNIKKDSLGNLSLGIRDMNQIYSIETESWFKLTPYNDSLRIELVDKFGLDKSSQLKHKLNFSLTLSQIEMSDGLTRVIVQPTDKYGQIIPPNILQIPFVNGVEFMDVKPNIIPPPPPIKKRRGFGMLIGPSYGLYNINGTFQPTWGIGISVGYKIF
jgi:hypothetical protein|tara:strand:+ start:4376 stop:5269 length:894 start_codon:yes stop_codon:yes gene_type:complete